MNHGVHHSASVRRMGMRDHHSPRHVTCRKLQNTFQAFPPVITTCSLLVVNCTSRISRSLMAETFSRASLLAALAGLPVMSRLVTSPPSPTPPPSPPDSPIPHTGR